MASKPDLAGASPFEIQEARKAARPITPKSARPLGGARQIWDVGNERPGKGVAGSYGDNPEDQYRRGGSVKNFCKGGKVISSRSY